MTDFSTYPILSRHITTLKDTSIDKRDSGEAVYMTGSTRPAVHFDQVKEEYVKDLKLSEVPKSNDALITDGDDKFIFIEFKNGYMDRTKQFSVRKKIYDSVLIFSDIISIGISDMRTRVEYILVYFGVKLFENYCFKKVHTYTEKEFERYISAL